MGVQKAYLSKVTKAQVQLNSDQIFLLAEYVGLNPNERVYLQLLLEYSRSGLKSRKDQLRKQIEELGKQERDTRQKLKAAFIEAEASERVAYYLDPYSLLVHLFLTVDRYRKNVDLIGDALLLSPNHLRELLGVLEKNEFIRWNANEKSYEVINDHFHIHKTSPLSPPHQALTRVISSAQLLRLKPEQRSTFNITFSADHKTYTSLQESFVNWLKSIESMVRAANADDVYQLNFDLFPWDPKS